MKDLTKRDVADIVLLWMAITLFFSLLASLATLGAIIGMPENEYATKSMAAGFQTLHFLVLLLLNYALFFRRAWVLDLVFPGTDNTGISIPEGLAVLTSYAFWIRLIGIFTFLTSTVAFFSHLVMDIATNRRFVTGTFWMMKSGTALVSAVLAVLIIWKADWIAGKLGKMGSSNTTGIPPVPQP